MLAAQVFFLVFLISSQGSPTKSTASSFEAIAHQAEAAKSSNQLNEAIKLYSEGLRIRPNWSEGWWSLASVFYEQDRFLESRAAFTRFTKLVHNSGPAYAFLGLCEYETKDYDLALRHFETWSKSGAPGTDALIDVAGYHWALVLAKKGQFQEALYLFAAKAKKLGVNPDLTEAMGLASLRMENLPIDYPQEERELVWLAGKAAIYAALQDTERSEEYARRLAERYPRDKQRALLSGDTSRVPEKVPRSLAAIRGRAEDFTAECTSDDGIGDDATADIRAKSGATLRESRS